MRVVIALEGRYVRTPDQRVWSDGVPDYCFWRRYLDVFDSVEILARVQDVPSVPARYKPADGDKVTFIPLPYYIGPYQFVCNAMGIDRIAKAVARDAEAVILRIPGQVSSSLFRHLKSRPYGVEVVGDPYDVFAVGAVNHPLRAFFRWWATKQVQKQCRSAAAASYVTETTLQQRYPSSCYSTHYSSVDMAPDSYVSEAKSDFGKNGLFRIIFIGSLAQMYKAPDVLIDSIELCCRKGLMVDLRIIGDGKFRPGLQEQVNRLHLSGSVTFLGQLAAGEAVRNELMLADLFILPSRTEGLPRAMIEAMACGLPCIGTCVGGIPELLSADDLVPSGDAQALADKIEEVIKNPQRMHTMSVRNLQKSLQFSKDLLDLRRRELYQHLLNSTQSWLTQKRT